MTGREKCEFMRKFRAVLAWEYEIPLHQERCDYPGDDCLGTCPLCEQELRYLTEAIDEKRRNGNVFKARPLDPESLEFQSNPFLREGDFDFLTLDPFEDDDLTGCIEYIGPDEYE